MEPSSVFVEDTIKVFSLHYGRRITIDEAEEIILNFGKLLEALGSSITKSEDVHEHIARCPSK